MKKSLSRRFTVIIVSVILLILIGGIILLAIHEQVQQTYMHEKDSLYAKQEVLEKVDKHFNLLVFRGRGFFAYQNEDEFTLLHQERVALQEELITFEQFPLHDEERELVSELRKFLIFYFIELLPRARENVENKNYDGLMELSREGITDLTNQLIELTDKVGTDTELELNNLHETFIAHTNRTTFFFLGYVLFILLLIGLAIRKIVTEIGTPLRELAVTSEHLALGKDVTFSITKREDEIGKLSNALESMVRSLQAKEEELTAQNEELIAQQEELTKQQERLKDLLFESEESKNKLELYNQFVHSVATTLDRNVLMTSIIQAMDQLFPSDKSILILNNENYDYEAIGVSKKGAEQLINSLEEGFAVRLMQTKKLHITSRVATETEKGFHEEKMRSYDLYIPLFSTNGELLAIYISTRIGVPFSEKEKMEQLALMNQAALSLDNLHFYESAEQSRQMNQDIINNVNEGIQLINTKGELIQLNEKLTRIFEWEGENLLYSPLPVWSNRLFKNVKESGKLLFFMNKAIRNKNNAITTLRYEITEPSYRVIDVYAQSIFRLKDKIGTIFVHRDITIEHEVDQMKSELVSTVSHELRTPLASVIGFTELMLTKQLKPERQRKYLETIHKEAVRLTNLINDFLDLQRMESGKQFYEKKPVKINDVLQHVLDVFRERYQDRKFLYSHVEQEVFIYGDREKLIQLFTNLIGNGVKFSPDGGNIEITMRTEENILHLDVTDYGLGIPEKELKHLFQKFYRIDNSDRRKIGGTGLGLAISKEIATVHDGAVTVSSIEGKGSTFTVSLPIYYGHSAHPTSQPSENSQPRLVVLEDDNSLALLLKEQLMENGFTVYHETDGEKALDIIYNEQPDAVVVDLLLDNSTIDGWSVIEQMKREDATKNIPIIISSALDEKERGIANGVKHYLTKPYPPNKLSQLILYTLVEEKREGQIFIPDTDERKE